MLTDTDRISFQDKFKRDYGLLAQQMKSRLVEYCDQEPDAIDAQYFWFNFIGKTRPRKKTVFGGPTPHMSPQHYRYRGNVEPYEWGDAFDEAQLRTLVADPKNKHKMQAVAGFYREIDYVIIEAALGNKVVWDGTTKTTSETALPGTQLIAHGSAGMTFDKVRATKKKMDANEVLEGVPNGRLVMVHTAAQADNLLAEAKATSADYVSGAQALVDGKITHWMGFDWVRTELIPVNGSGHRRCFAMATNAIGYFGEKEPRVNIGKDAGASFIERIMLDQNLGATRQEDVRIVEVPCVEA